MLVTLLEMVTLVSPKQSPNAKLPILVTLLEIVTLVRLEHPANAKSLTLVTLLGIVTPVMQLPNARPIAFQQVVPW